MTEDFRNIRLPGAVIAGLYKDLLISDREAIVARPKKEPVKPAAAAGNAPPPIAKWWLGNNARGIIILVSDPENAFVADDCLNLLGGMLGACSRNLGDAAIVNLARTPKAFREIREALHAETCLLFGVTAAVAGLPFNIPNYQVQSFDGCKFVCAPPLSSLCGDGKEAKLEKSKLWVALKKAFDL